PGQERRRGGEVQGGEEAGAGVLDGRGDEGDEGQRQPAAAQRAAEEEAGRTVSKVIRIGPRLGGTVVDIGSRTVKFRFRPACRLDEVKQLRLREYFSQIEEEQLLNRNPAVQKSQR